MTSEITQREAASRRVAAEKLTVGQIELVALDVPAVADVADRTAGGGDLRKLRWRPRWLFIFVVLLPVSFATLYFGFLAADIYVSEAKFIVRSTRSEPGLGSLLGQNQGISRAVDETYAVTEFMLSRDAAERLARDHDLRAVMSRPEGDLFNRFPNGLASDNQERFFRAYLGFVDAEVDRSTGISTLEVKAFRPDDAQAIGQALLAIAEDFVNRMNLRANRDAEVFASAQVEEAQARLAEIEVQIADYRNRELVVDPGQESSNSLANLGKMATEIYRLEATLKQQMALTPNSPTIAPLREQIRSYREEMQNQQRRIVGGPNSIASKIQGYEMLMLRRDLAAKILASAVAELERARHEAQSQRIYLQTVTEANRADYPLLPYRIPGILGVTLLCGVIYKVVRSFIDATMEHRA